MSRTIRYWPIGGLVLLGLFLFLGPLAVGRVGLWGDDLIQNFPLRVLVGRVIDSGHFPLWNPFEWSGSPLLAGFNAGGAYPLTLLFAFIPPALAWCLGEVFTFAWGAVGLYCFLGAQGVKPWPAAVGSMAWTIGGAFSGQWVHVATVQAASWLPWALFGIQGVARASGAAELARSAASAALAGGMILLSGSPEMAVYGLVLVVCYVSAVSPRTMKRGRVMLMGLAALAVAVMIGAAQWLPGLDFIAQSQRARATFAFFNSFAMPPRLSTLFFTPYLLGGYGYGGASAQYFGPLNLPEVSGYMGLLPLMAFFATLPAWWGKHPLPAARVWHVVAVLGLALAWGGHTPIGAVMYHLPGYGLLRDQSRNLMEVDLALAMLTALWLDSWPAARINRRWAGIPLVLAGIVVAGYAVDARGVVSWVSGVSSSLAQARAVAPAVWTAGAMAGAAGLLLIANPGRRWRMPAWVAFLAVNLGVYAAGQYWTHPAPVAVTRGAQPPWSRLDGVLGKHGRIALYDPSLADKTILDAAGQPDLNVLSGVYSVQGYGSIVSQRYFAATGAHAQLAYKPRALSGRMADRLNLGLLIARPDDFSRPVEPGSRAPRSPLLTLGPHQSRWLYLGRPLTVRQVFLAMSAPAASSVRITAFTPRLRAVSPPIAAVRRQRAQVAVFPPHVQTAVGLKVTNLSAASIDLRRAAVLTPRGVRYRLDGPLVAYVRPPQWRYLDTTGRMVLFRNTQTHGWAWYAKGAQPFRTVHVSRLPQGGFSAEVHLPTPALLVVSQTYTPGWYASIHEASKPVSVIPAARYGVIQSFRMPAGSYRVDILYRSPAFVWGMVITMAGFALLLAGVVIMARRPVKYTCYGSLDPAP